MIEIFQDIRKTYNFDRPSDELADVVEFYGETCKEKTRLYLDGRSYTIRMFPSWTPTFYINLGEPYQMLVGTRSHGIAQQKDVLILRNSIVERFNHPADHIYIVKFHPGGMEGLFHIRQSLLADQVIDLSQVLPFEFLNNLKLAGDFRQRCALMDNYLLGLGRSHKQKDHYLKLVRSAIGEYNSGAMQLSVSTVAEKSFVTSKTISRYFKQTIGVSPKAYFSMLRSRTALAGYVQDNTQFNPYQYGYFDHSHFYKDVFRFTGQKISEHRL
ncbi:hypothetical protein SNE26_24655 [Mucilaginibacter sp. cycad4]|uniref:helix-turn-helix domain-containing protein n=1 Tax=Mucilaginibacter sp. cycad4 TaxID=3342096 RepID=UPI002AAC00A9|nr:hypothetical protein [Mucilaginibacter gossypii]WPU99208.1 hypothetical protein SNE26_24655 [Mucilaginibacter gossypii]